MDVLVTNLYDQGPSRIMRVHHRSAHSAQTLARMIERSRYSRVLRVDDVLRQTDELYLSRRAHPKGVGKSTKIVYTG